MKKTIPALLAAFMITICIGAGVLLVGGNALLNANGVQISNVPTPANAQRVSVSVQNVTSDQFAQVQQLQSQIAQYQQREQQYQSELSQAADRINSANAQIQQYQALLLALQQRGIITVGSDGRVYLNER